MSIKQAIEEPSDAATKLAEMILSDCGHSTAITTALRDRVALRIDKYTDTLAALRSMPAEPDPTPERPIAATVPPATARDRWFYEQGRLAERDPRTTPHTAPVPLSDAEIYRLWGGDFGTPHRVTEFARAIERAVLGRGGEQ